MKVNETRVDRFLATSETSFTIPVYQRNYDWGLSQCKQLFHDIYEVGRNDGIDAHFIGSVVDVYDDVPSASGQHELTVIDGQQRLTTLTLIYIAIYRLAKRYDMHELMNKIYKIYLINEFAQEEEKLKLKPTENNKAAMHHVLNADEGEEFQGYSRLVENYDFFKGRITIDNYKIILNGLSKLIFVDIALDRTKDNPQRIFESLNSTGLELSQADLIRNYILMGLNRREQDHIYKNYWEAIEQHAKDEETNDSKVSEFIRDYLTLKNREIPNKKDVYAKFKQQYPVTSSTLELEAVLSELKSLAKVYHKLLNPSGESDHAIRRQLEYIKQLEINVAYPFLMKVYEDYGNNTIDKFTFLAVLNLIQSYTWRRFIVGLPTNALNKVFMSLYGNVDSSKYLYSIQKTLRRHTGSQRFPNDLEIKNALKEKNVYDINSKNRTYLLSRLENHQNQETVEIGTLTIEHIFPQNPDPKWKIDLGEEEYNKMKEVYLNTVGNLTLSGNNGKLGNKPFVEKRDMNIDGREQGYKFSRLWLNRDLKDKTVWNSAEIEKRTTAITERFLQIWEFPDIQIEDGDATEAVNIFDAEDPTGKKMKYYIFLGQHVEVETITQLYTHIFSQLFDLQPDKILSPRIKDRILISKNPADYGTRSHVPLSDTYCMCTQYSNIDKFGRIKEALTLCGYEDELFIKYAAEESR
jgi:uncharacterized protein with ParB-like and HNH nuclease domain